MEKYALLKILDENGYIPSTENLNILTNELAEGSTIILNVNNISLCEGMDEDYFYMQLLDNNGLKVTEKNISIIKESIENGHVLFEASDDDESTTKKIGKRVGRTLAGMAIGAGLGAGAAAATKGISDAVGKKAASDADAFEKGEEFGDTTNKRTDNYTDSVHKSDIESIDKDIQAKQTQIDAIKKGLEGKDSFTYDGKEYTNSTLKTLEDELEQLNNRKQYYKNRWTQKVAKDVSGAFDDDHKSLTWAGSAGVGGVLGGTVGGMLPTTTKKKKQHSPAPKPKEEEKEDK